MSKELLMPYGHNGIIPGSHCCGEVSKYLSPVVFWVEVNLPGIPGTCQVRIGVRCTRLF